MLIHDGIDDVSYVGKYQGLTELNAGIFGLVGNGNIRNTNKCLTDKEVTEIYNRLR